MTAPAVRAALGIALAVLFLLRLDLWWWDEPGRIAGLPIGLAWQVVICVAASALLGLLVRTSWPRGLDDAADDGPTR